MADKITIKKKEKDILSSQTNDNKITDPDNFLIVGIGASAGGLEALEQFFANMPENNGMAFVVIQHLDPNYVGMMPELLQRITKMKVMQATDGLKIRPNCVYVIPPNKRLSVLNRNLHLFELLESDGLRLPIDFFFCSLANDQHEKSIGIILSGMGSDGSLGLKAIKEKNGIVLVEDPIAAKYDAMPGNALKAVVPDIVASAGELPAKLISFLHFTPATVQDPDYEIKNKSNLDKIIILIREQSGHDFSMYKKNTLFRRIERRKGIHEIAKIQDYVRFLQENPQELDILFKELLIGVSSFFRDEAVWEKLKENVLPKLIKELANGHILRAWVPACSTGEEAFSLAIVFKEVMEQFKLNKNITLQVFATDLDKDAIEIARKGFYQRDLSTEMSTERLKQFFAKEKNGFRVKASIREMVIFAPQNVIKDLPFTKLDIISCRNLLIYLEPELQNKLKALFNYSINPGGIMILGTAETLGNQNQGFEDLDSKLKIYKRNSSIGITGLHDFPISLHPRFPGKIEAKILPKLIENIPTLTDQILLQRFAPASVLVNANGDIIYITGKTGKYLEPAAGKANWNIYAMARPGLSNELPSAFRKVIKDYNPLILPNIKIESHEGQNYVDITIQQLESPDAIKGMIIFVFNDIPASLKTVLVKTKYGKSELTETQKELESELHRANQELQSTREDMQTSQEELKSINEELQSTNEELQSTNEELTTSKEEMQSLNEELQTVNIELQSKVNDYMMASDDMNNLLNSTQIATLFLDKDLNIRKFTDYITKIFKVRITDIGRPFTDLVSDLQYPEISNDAIKVIKTLTTIETGVTTADNRWFNVRIMPYRTIDDRIDGLVITFTDITESKKLELELNAIKKTAK